MSDTDTAPMDCPASCVEARLASTGEVSVVRTRGTRGEWLAFVDTMALAAARARELARRSGDRRMALGAECAEELLDAAVSEALAARREDGGGR